MSSLLRDLERVQPEENPKDEPEGNEVAEAFQEALKKLNEKVENLTIQLSDLTKETEKSEDPEDPENAGPEDPEEEG